MILDKKTAVDLEALLHPDVEEALLKLFDYIEVQERSIERNPEAKFEELKLFQGKVILLSELRQYKQRIIDGVQSK